jgi:transcription initiation factor TFIIB
MESYLEQHKAPRSAQMEALIGKTYIGLKECRNETCQGGSSRVDYEQGYRFCDQCGEVLESRRMIEEKEWNVYEQDHGRSEKDRVGQIEDARTKLLGEHTTLTGHMAKIHDKHRRTEKQEILAGAHRAAEKLMYELQLPKKVYNSCLDVLNELSTQDVLKERNIDAMVAVAMFIACGVCDVERTVKEIKALSHVKSKAFNKAFNRVKKLKIKKRLYKLMNAGKRDGNVKRVAKEVKYLDRFSSELGLAFKVTKLAKSIAQRASDEGLSSGKTPSTFASASLFMAAHLHAPEEKVTFQDVHKVCGMAVTTIRGAYDTLFREKKRILDKTVIIENHIKPEQLANIGPANQM